MMDEASQDNLKHPFLRLQNLENSLIGPNSHHFPDYKDFEEIDHNTKGGKSKSFNNYLFPPSYNLLPERPDMDTQNNFEGILASRKDLIWKPNMDFDISAMGSNHSLLNFQNSFNNLQFPEPYYNIFNPATMNMNIPMNDERKNLLKESMSLKSRYYNFDSQFMQMNPKENVKRLMPMGTLEDEPIYVNEKQYNRMMIRRVKRAEQTMKFQKKALEQNTLEKLGKKYKYESRHLHASKRPRDENGKFIRKDNNMTQDSNETPAKKKPQRKTKDIKKLNLKKTKTSKNAFEVLKSESFHKNNFDGSISLKFEKPEFESIFDPMNSNLPDKKFTHRFDENDSEEKNVLNVSDMKREDEA